MHKVLHAVVLTVLFCANVWACGQERWPVKVGTDRDVQRIAMAPTSTNIALLAQRPAPLHPENRRNSRFG